MSTQIQYNTPLQLCFLLPSSAYRTPFIIQSMEFVVEVTKGSDIQFPEASDSNSILKKNAKDGFGRSSSLPSSTLTEGEEVKLIWRISQDCGVQIRFEGHVTREALQKLVALLELSKDDYPSRERTAIELAHSD